MSHEEPGPNEESRSITGLLVSQFFGAFNDNAWKLIATLLGIALIHAKYDNLPGEPDPVQLAANIQSCYTIAFVVFTLPLMLFSLPAGVLADRFSKRSVILAMKVLELVLMATGTLILFVGGGFPLQMVILGLMGLQSAVFSPAKYGILPELLPHEKLSHGNGKLGMWTMLAMITGSGAAGFLLHASGSAVWLVGVVLTGLSAIGLLGALKIPKVPAAGVGHGVAETVRGAWGAIRKDRVLWLTVVGAAFYWALASLLMQDGLVYIKHDLEGSDTAAGLMLAFLGIGVACGCVLASRLSKDKVETGLMPLGGIGMSLFTLLLGLMQPGSFGTDFFMFLVGVSGGLVVVPLEALLQWRAPADKRGSVIALANVFIFGGVLFGSLLTNELAPYFSTSGIMIVAGLLAMAATIWALFLLPVAFIRFVLLVLTNTLYRLHVVGGERLPREGGALLVPNHVSFADGLFLSASTDRPIRFLIESNYFEHPLLKKFLTAVGAIPISSTGNPKDTLRSLREAGKYLDRGELVCIFAEGQITRTGTLLPFKRGLERIVKGRTTPIIPVNLAQVWGSIFSRSGNRFLFKLPRRIPYPVTISFGDPIANDCPIPEIRAKVHELGQEALDEVQKLRPPLHHSFIWRCRRVPFRFIYADSKRPHCRRYEALAGLVIFAQRIRDKWVGQERVGIFLPPSIAAAIANIAAALAGKTSVNLNYTAGTDGLESAIKQAGIRTIVTSREFLEKAKVELPKGPELIWVEDLMAGISKLERVKAALMGMLLPIRVLERIAGATRPVRGDDIATIIFSSGSTGDPKGVMLSHHNIDSNVEAVAQVLRDRPDDRLLGILPLFHSFGYMALWFTANHGMGVVWHPNPLDPGAIGTLIERYRVTMLVATPTFLQIYLRRCTPAQFGSLRLIVAGAERLTTQLADAFQHQFGIRPLQGYGTTECSPVVSVNVPDFRAPGFFQPGSRVGTVGQALPSVSIKIVDVDTGEPVPFGESGMILVRGPGVMTGYLDRPDLTEEVMRDGWYVTGDVGILDEQGFLRITDRLSRFSKIGGEMVPHGKVEEGLNLAAGSEVKVFAVTALPDERKGERLVVVHTFDEDRIPEVLECAQANGMPNLFLPRPENFIRVDELPLLGTGKLDLRELKRIAETALGGDCEAKAEQVEVREAER